MNTLAVINIIISDRKAAGEVNAVLHDVGDYVLGRMGIPYAERSVNVICVVIDAPQEIINSVSGKLGMIKGVKSKVLTTK